MYIKDGRLFKFLNLLGIKKALRQFLETEQFLISSCLPLKLWIQSSLKFGMPKGL